MATYERSPFIAERRRTLFPTDDQDMDSELGSPLSSDNSDTEQTMKRLSRTYSESMSPLRLSPFTPKKVSPLRNLKTPHDSTTKPILEKEQKALTEESKSLGRRPRTPSSSPEGSKSEGKVSKVRTALFAQHEDGLPAKSFYSKEFLEKDKVKLTSSLFRPVKLSGGGKPRPHSGRRFGQINNGVRHNIRKPKPKKVGVKAPLRQLQPNGAVLTEYLQDLSELRPESRKKLIKTFTDDKENVIKEEENHPTKEDDVKLPGKAVKRAASPQESQPRKIFKSHNKDVNDFLEEDSETSIKIDSILTMLSSPVKELSSQVNDTPNNQITLEAHSSVLASENSIQLHLTDSILSPISHMCDVTSGLALDSPTTQNVAPTRYNCSARVSKMLSFNDHPDMSKPDGQVYPIFRKDYRAPQKRPAPAIAEPKKGPKRLRRLPPDQMLLDAGQKRWGVTLCNECDTVYHLGDPNDELEHTKYHSGIQVWRFTGWKNERVVADFQAKGRIIKVLPHDSAAWLAKVKNVLTLVNRELGGYETETNITESQVYLYVKKRMIVGCAVAAVPKGPAHRMLSSVGGAATCSEETYPVKCGVVSLWVAAAHRRQGIASALMDSIKNTFALGEVLTDQQVALTAPTEAGSIFAEKYFKSPNYLVYFT